MLGSGGTLLMAGGGDRSVVTGVLACILACPTVGSFGPSDPWRRRCAWISYLPAQFSNGAGETGNILEGVDQIAVAENERGGEGTVCGGDCCHRHVIARSGGGQVCNDVDSFLLIYMVGGLVVNKSCGMVAGTCDGGLRFAELLVGGEKKYLELNPGLVGWILSFPLLAVVGEHSSLKYQLICDANDLKRGVQGIPGRGVLDSALDLVD